MPPPINPVAITTLITKVRRRHPRSEEILALCAYTERLLAAVYKPALKPSPETANNVSPNSPANERANAVAKKGEPKPLYARVHAQIQSTKTGQPQQLIGSHRIAGTTRPPPLPQRPPPGRQRTQSNPVTRMPASSWSDLPPSVTGARYEERRTSRTGGDHRRGMHEYRQIGCRRARLCRHRSGCDQLQPPAVYPELAGFKPQWPDLVRYFWGLSVRCNITGSGPCQASVAPSLRGAPACNEEKHIMNSREIPLKVVVAPAVGVVLEAPPVLMAYTCGRCATAMLHADEGQVHRRSDPPHKLRLVQFDGRIGRRLSWRPRHTIACSLGSEGSMDDDLLLTACTWIFGIVVPLAFILFVLFAL